MIPKSVICDLGTFFGQNCTSQTILKQYELYVYVVTIQSRVHRQCISVASIKCAGVHSTRCGSGGPLINRGRPENILRSGDEFVAKKRFAQRIKRKEPALMTFNKRRIKRHLLLPVDHYCNCIASYCIALHCTALR